MNLVKRQEALRRSYEERTLRLIGASESGENGLLELLNEWPTLYPPWTKRLEEYDYNRFGPLLAVSDEGSAAPVIAEAAYESAKTRSLASPEPMAVGVMIDGERMSSAGEAPIGPDEYEKVIGAAFGRTLCSTNVGVRANARVYRLFPEFSVAGASGSDSPLHEKVFAAFKPFLDTPDRLPRPLTVRLRVSSGDSPETLRSLIENLKEGRGKGQLAAESLHRLSLLMVFNREIRSDEDVTAITQMIQLAAELGIPELAIDGELTLGARERLSVQSLLNVVEIGTLSKLFVEASRRNVRLVYRYQIDTESAARTIWTGLHAARSYGFTVGKYGLVPLALEEQLGVIELIEKWTKGWTAIPAFYADTPLLTHNDVFDQSRCTEAALLWLQSVSALGVKTVLVDCPDRVSPRHLVRDEAEPGNKGVLTLTQLSNLQQRAAELGVKILWSGGITAKQAFALAARGAFGIFSTSATARQVAVHGVMTSDPELAGEGEPTNIGVRRVHAAIQGGFLGNALLLRQKALAAEVKEKSEALLQSIDARKDIQQSLSSLDEALVRGWSAHWEGIAPLPSPQVTTALHGVAVPPDAVRVWRGRRRADLAENEFFDKLGKVFMPFTVQMQRLYGLTAYLPAVIHGEDGLPDEIALVFYKTRKAYDDAKKYPGGQAYSDLHSVVFDLGKSSSGFPEFLGQSFSLDKPYYLLQMHADWKKGIAQLYVGHRRKGLSLKDYCLNLQLEAQNIQKNPGAIDGAILFATKDWMIYWQHSTVGNAPISTFSQTTESIMKKEANCEEIPTAFFSPVNLVASPGDFFNFQFPVMD